MTHIFSKRPLNNLKKSQILVFYLPTKACGSYGGEERYIQGLVEKRRRTCHLKGLGIDGRIILKWICKKYDAGGRLY
jgi:hypothetical protein